MQRSLLLLTIIALFFYSEIKAQTLRQAGDGLFLMGVAVNSRQTEGARPAEAAQISKHFNAIVPENCMKSAEIHPEEHLYRFEATDKMVAFGENNQQVITGHCLIWHSQLAPWFCVDEQGKPVSAELLKARMREHIFTIMTRYKGRIKGYDVVNEALEDNGSYRNSPFYQILGKDFIRLAFEYAHEADPEAELYYNDYSMTIPSKCDAVVQMVQELKAAGCRIDAVGMQGHVHMDEPSTEAFETSILKLAAAGVKVLITEWDISILPNPYRHTGANIADRFSYSSESDPYRQGVPDEVMQAWEQRVTDLFKLFLKHHEHIDRVTLWGLNDGNSWRNNFPIRGRKDYALLFDRNNQPKAVVQQMIELALEAKSK
ncbi:MAG: endo-1,4-beta-xylanase [Bacteroidales bacterium]|nr:endo-1,4-beta-xylanase [Bacteroidales bacterium]MDD3430888.1 endo-1,4-beta-xylanase [Bacteroidales bacterium]MDD4361290.1 endo-1,4-beta-xylanase [Bacteroidales bacterium]MDD4429927.1 endo-1,4-beta-xylanase [Bacteroidales bacterium]